MYSLVRASRVVVQGIRQVHAESSVYCARKDRQIDGFSPRLNYHIVLVTFSSLNVPYSLSHFLPPPYSYHDVCSLILSSHLFFPKLTLPLKPLFVTVLILSQSCSLIICLVTFSFQKHLEAEMSSDEEQHYLFTKLSWYAFKY